MAEYSIFDLAFTYIQRFYQEEPSREEKQRIVKEIEELLLTGWTSEDIIKTIRVFIEKYPGIKPDIPTLFSKAYKSKQNLLHSRMFYYHNQLRIMSGPPKRDFDYNTGEIVKIDEPFFMEIRASYTVDDLTDYFISQFRIDVVGDDRKRYIGSFKYLLKTYPIDLLLFMIDAAANHTYSEDRNHKDFSPLDLQNWRTVAEDAWNAKCTETKISGDDRIVPRQRVFSFRSGSPD